MKHVAAFGHHGVRVKFDHAITMIVRHEPSFLIEYAPGLFSTGTPADQLAPDEIAYFMDQEIGFFKPYSWIARPVSFRIAPWEFPFPQTGETYPPPP